MNKLVNKIVKLATSNELLSIVMANKTRNQLSYFSVVVLLLTLYYPHLSNKYEVK